MPPTPSHTYEFSANTTSEEVLAAMERNYSKKNPDIGKTQSCWLKEGPKVFKFAIIHEIIDRHTKQHHHTALTLYSFKKHKDGWINQEERKITLDDATGDEIGILETLIDNFRAYTNSERKVYDVIDSEERKRLFSSSKSDVEDVINGILEDAESYKKIVEQGGLTLVKDVVNWVFRQRNAAAIIEQLNTVDMEVLQELTTVAGISQINKILDIWNTNKSNSSEDFWQRTLTEHSWIISQIFAAPAILYGEKAYLGGKTIENTGGNVVDILYKNKLSSNTILVELKTPCTRILGSDYRQTYSMSNELSGAINQTLNYKHQFQQNHIFLQMNHKGAVYEVINPKAYLIIGNISEELLDEHHKIEAFELYRQNLKDVCVITYDELFEKVEILKSILQNGI